MLASRMLEGLPPNTAAYMMRLVCDESRARAIADLIVESFEPAETAASAKAGGPCPSHRRTSNSLSARASAAGGRRRVMRRM